MDNKAKLHKELKALWHKKVFSHWGDLCVCCGEKATAAHHYVPKSRSLALRYDLNNGVPICRSCHWTIHFSPSPDDIHRLCEIIREDRGETWCNYIDDMKVVKGKNTIWYLEEVLERLEK